MYLVSGRMLCENGELKQSVTLKAGWAQKKQMEQWFSGEETYDSKGQKVVEFYFNSSGILKYRKERGVINPKTVLSDVGSTKSGSEELKNILGTDGGFDYPKPVELIKFLIGLYGEDCSVLDFFAGSGTTLQAVMELNKDGGKRRCILVTNNENNICEEVTYERNKRVIQGYTNAKGQQVPGLTQNNLRYYRNKLVSRETSIKNKRELTRLATELLCIKENCYTECTLAITGAQHNWLRLFADGQGQYLCAINDDSYIEEGVAVLQQLIKSQQPRQLVKVYVFSNGQYPYTEEFEDVLEHITLCALPDAIYKAYQNVLPRKKAKPIPVVEEPTAEEVEASINGKQQFTLFNEAKENR